ncbi:Thiol:disulfide interchange protein DsbE [invertebrate metagenome]|uniref:Thiol:disulfide interchange protein DsbE n=1 Tax=invertebrate metagenome TaxID=1711999 RepID=A0A2H9T9V7_9ZZZZ
MKRWTLLLPLILFLGLCVMFWISLLQGKKNHALPSALLNQPVPNFSLGSLTDENHFLTEKEIIGKPALINIWATWCTACAIEHPFLLKLANEGVIIYGVNYKDDPDKARQWLQQKGNPFRETLLDQTGKLGIDLGVYGAPETFLIDNKGIIHYRHIGILDQSVWNQNIRQFYEALNNSMNTADKQTDQE